MRSDSCLRPSCLNRAKIAPTAALARRGRRFAHFATLLIALRVALGASPLPLNDSFELPFLGTIRAHSRQEQVEVTTPAGKLLALSMKVFYGADGRFMRGEYFKEGSTNYQFPAKKLQEGYESHGEEILGIPAAAAEVKLPSVLQSLYQHQPFDAATRINVTYVEFQKSGRNEGPVFNAEVWGVADDFFPLQHLEGHRKYRCIMNPQGKLIFFSNAL